MSFNIKDNTNNVEIKRLKYTTKCNCTRDIWWSLPVLVHKDGNVILYCDRFWSKSWFWELKWNKENARWSGDCPFCKICASNFDILPIIWSFLSTNISAESLNNFYFSAKNVRYVSLTFSYETNVGGNSLYRHEVRTTRNSKWFKIPDQDSWIKNDFIL